jgi:hypothetical protein
LVSKIFIVLFNLTYNTCKLLFQFFAFTGVFYAQENIEVVFGAIFEQHYAVSNMGANMDGNIIKIIEVNERVVTSLAYL